MGDSSVSTSGTKKKKGLLRSLGKGLSRKKKKNKPDDASIVSVALDRGGTAPASRTSAQRKVSFGENKSYAPGSANSPGGSSSSATASSSTAAGAKPIQVVLLLMDPTSRRFELLQLEFDSNKAMVSDVLRQIQSSATEETLRDTKYAGVCDASGLEMIASMKLSKFCKGNDVVMAMPQGMTGNDTAKLAGPILGDPKVEDMLAPCGVKVPPKPVRKSRSPISSTKLTKISEEETRQKQNKEVEANGGGNAKSTKKTSSSSALPTMILGIIISSLLFFTAQRHLRVTSPIESGDVLLPGQWKSQCGIFDLFPSEWLEKIPMDKLAPSCDASSSSTLELGTDGTMRYFTRGDDNEQRKEVWSVVGSGGKQCSEGEDEQCYEEGAKFEKDGDYWYVVMSGARTSLSTDVVRDFTSES